LIQINDAFQYARRMLCCKLRSASFGLEQFAEEALGSCVPMTPIMARRGWSRTRSAPMLEIIGYLIACLFVVLCIIGLVKALGLTFDDEP
jgi:hypothetical protein